MSADVRGDDGWQRLHPLSPLVRSGRIVPVVVFALVVSVANSHSNGGGGEETYLISIAVLTVLLGLVSWLVTRWKIDGETLRIETGLIRRDARQLPLSRIQSVDIVRPLLARLFGVSELRIRLAGSGSSDGRLAYLGEQTALALRGRLLTAHHDLDPATTEQVETVMVSVPTGRLVGSVLLSGGAVVLLALIAALVITAAVAPGAGGAVIGFLGIYIFGTVAGMWRVLSSEYRFEAVEAPEGVRIRRGLLQTVTETVPYARIQAVRRREPLFWRPLHWCRVEVDIAGAGGRAQRGEGGTGVVRKALLPVGGQGDADHLVNRLMSGTLPAVTPPPRVARWKAPFSYHFLAAGHDSIHAVCTTGRVRRETAIVPLEKAQSVRLVQGPLQRRLGLATVYVDVAGRRVRGEFRERSVADADSLVAALSDLSRAARQDPVRSPAARRARPVPDVPASPGVPPDQGPAPDHVIPADWYPDPSGRHELRYWRDGRWTEHVSDRGSTAVDPP